METTEKARAPFLASLNDSQRTIYEALCESHYLAGAKAAWGAAQEPDGEACYDALVASRKDTSAGYAEAKAALRADARPVPADDVEGLARARPQFEGCMTPEPCLRDVVMHYYRQAFTREEAVLLADQYLRALAQKETGR